MGATARLTKYPTTLTRVARNCLKQDLVARAGCVWFDAEKGGTLTRSNTSGLTVFCLLSLELRALLKTRSNCQSLSMDGLHSRRNQLESFELLK